MPIQIQIADSQDALAIESNLLASLRSSLQQSVNEQFVLAAKLDDGALIGGLTASTSYGWLLIKTLWVGENQQRQGLGTSLVQEAELKASELGCHGAWLDTSSPDAKLFYERLGYAVFGNLSNSENQTPSSHQRWFMRKSI
ncbi:MAG: GNAT family N-acetyltransferase [Gammaproteobacteria bacterium]|nr:GNAT family N-acetyltransferase [Gammaproteobacteria bacterium]